MNDCYGPSVQIIDIGDGIAAPLRQMPLELPLVVVSLLPSVIDTAIDIRERHL